MQIRPSYGGIACLIDLIGSVAPITINCGWSACDSLYRGGACENSFVQQHSSDVQVAKGLTKLTNAILIYIEPL